MAIKLPTEAGEEILPVGKLPPHLLQRLLAQSERLGADPSRDPAVLLGPGIGLDCAVIDLGERCLVLKSDPITFASQEIGWYALQVNANDLACMGAAPRWLLLTCLLPEGKTTAQDVEHLADKLYRACAEMGVTVVGGHTEITHGLERPLLVGALIGDVAKKRLVTPRGARPGDRLLLTKGVPIEATALLAGEFPSRLRDVLSPKELEQARRYLYEPGISVLKDARLALAAGIVHAMHDPTEGGLYTAAWELAEASGCSAWVEREAVPVPELGGRICRALGLDPLAAIASGALLLAAPSNDARLIQQALTAGGILCVEIGTLSGGLPEAWIRLPGADYQPMPRPARDAVAVLFDADA